MLFNVFAERRAHPPLGAGSEVSQGVEVVVTGEHVNRTAPSGWMVRLVELSRSAAGVLEWFLCDYGGLG